MKISYVLIAAVIFCSACGSKSKTRKSPNGYEMEVVREGEGNFAQPGQVIVMNMLYKDDKDSIWFDTRTQGAPAMQIVQDTSRMDQEKGIENTFRSLKKGDSVKIRVTTKSFFENTLHQPVPPEIKPETNLTFLIGVIEVTDREGVNKFQEKMQTRQLEKDIQAIDAYLMTNGIVALKDSSGLRYVITKAGTGEKPPLSSLVKVNYKGSLLENGKIFDQSRAPLEYQLRGFIQGWQIGFQLLPKGTTATFYIPSSLGYGLNGYPPDIPPNANLVFEVELIDFK